MRPQPSLPRHRRLALRAGTRGAALAGGIWPLVVRAAEPAAPSSLGTWIFLTVAFVGIGLAAFAAGWWRARQGAASVATPTTTAAPSSHWPTTGPAPLGAEATRVAGPSDALSSALLQHCAANLAADPRPLLLLQGDMTGSGRVLQHANAAGLRMIGAEIDALGRAWPSLEAAAPASLRHALVDPGNPGGWWLLRDDATHTVLVLGPDAGSAEADTASLVYTVSHDLRAPIRVVEGFTRIVKEDYGRQLDRVGNDHLDRVLAAGARMNQMIDAVLTMAQLASQPLARQPVDLSQLAGYVIDDLRRAAPDRQVEVVIEPGLRTRGDPTLLRLVLENLLGNAWKYSGQNPQARVEFGATVGDGRRVYVVRDNGAGFDMRVADRLFGLFQRLHSAKDFPGTGVGLASVRRIVQRHGGEVWAESEPGRGAAFFFTLTE